MTTEGEYKGRERYSRGLFLVSLGFVVLLAAIAALLPFRYAGDRSGAKTSTLLENWGRHLYNAALDFAGKRAIADAVPVARLSLPSGSGRRFEVDLGAVGGSADVAAVWAQNALKGFDAEDYFIDGKLPLRRIGDIVYIDGRPYLFAISPAEPIRDTQNIELTLGPALTDDFLRLQGEGWRLAVVRGDNVVYSTEPRLPGGTLPEDEQLRKALAASFEFDTAAAINLEILDGSTAIVAPLKDFDQWDVIGAFVLARSSRPERDSPVAWLIALAGFVLAAGAFALTGRQLNSGMNDGGLLAPVALLIAGVVLAALVLVSLGIWLGGEVSLEAKDAFDWLASLSEGGTALGRADFLKSLDMLAVLALLSGVLGIGFVYLYSTRRLKHLAELRQAVAAAGFLGPAFVHLIIFTLAPVLFAFFISFHRWDVLGADKPFVGLANYLELFGDQLFWQSLFNTLIYSLHVPLTMVIALALALALQRNFRGVTILRTLFFLPYITSFVAISTVWQWLYNADFGLLNYLLSFLGVEPIAWLSDPATAMIAVMIMSIWIQLGYQMVIFIAGLQGIPQHLYEAATIDGAGPLTRLRRITLPLLHPTIFFILVTSIINSFQVFTYVYVMTQGGPLHGTEVLVYHIYKNAWEYFRMGYASALSWVLFVLILIITIAQFAFFKKRIEEATA
ncbi:MAG TPA: sugar ABC transporter permease [Acidobacteriota bacterium]|nr:sugar ABC transporter permease [Acidobacteriota bacterium]